MPFVGRNIQILALKKVQFDLILNFAPILGSVVSKKNNFVLFNDDQKGHVVSKALAEKL